MQLRELMEIQETFDRQHSSTFSWYSPITNDNMEPLTFLLICMVGELGELANCVKKIVRGDFPLDAKITEIEEEIADIFIYLVKICNQMNLDLEELFLRKIELNRKRFSNYTR